MNTGSFALQFAQQIVNGISLGSIYALIALGYTMIYGIIKLINFAHGDIYMLGAYIGFVAITKAHLPFLPALIIAMVGAALAGILIERIAYKPMRNAPRIAALITAIGVSFSWKRHDPAGLSPAPYVPAGVRTYGVPYRRRGGEQPADPDPGQRFCTDGGSDLHRQ